MSRVLFSLWVGFSILLVGSAVHAFEVHPGIEFLAVTDAPEGAVIRLSDPNGALVEESPADRFGSVIFYELESGRAYSVREDGAGGPATTVTIPSLEDVPADSFYASQELVGGYQYIETRDGTLLSVMVRPPLGFSMSQGPFPTLIAYSGYAESNPGAEQSWSLLSRALGYATVSVNMRGSGCSGGAFDLFDLATTADGYDIVEVVGRQAWVHRGKPGMVGLSFPAISQIYVGGARPPSLAAIAPIGVFSEVYRRLGYPGGIRNDGFVETWLRDRQRDARPAPEGGQGWARDRVNQGDTVCLENQKLRLQTRDVMAIVEDTPHYVPELMDDRSPINWVDKVEVPMFVAGAWQDEQTGSGFAELLAAMPHRRNVKAMVLNGVHSSPFESEILSELIAFFDLYVAGEIPNPGRAAPFAGVIAAQLIGPGSPIPPYPADRYDGIQSYGVSKKMFEDSPRIRVLFENGAGTDVPGLPATTFTLGFKNYPPQKKRDIRWYFGPNGTLSRRRPSRAQSGIDSYRPDPEARPMQTIPGQGQSESWVLQPNYDWRPLLGDTAVGYISPPLEEDWAIVGPSSVDLWLRSSAADTDLQATLTEVRPDGSEIYVQTGWLRASHRKPDRRKRTRLDPVQSHLEEEAEPMPDGEFTLARVPIFPVAHLFRSQSRIRVTVSAPGGDRTRWALDTQPTNGAVLNEIAHERRRPSRLVLPMLRRVGAPDVDFPCNSLRGQPCRTYEPAGNGG